MIGMIRTPSPTYRQGLPWDLHKTDDNEKFLGNPLTTLKSSTLNSCQKAPKSYFTNFLGAKHQT